MPSPLSPKEQRQLAELTVESKNAQQAVKLADLILQIALEHHASDIHIEPYEQEVIARFRIDGILYDACTLSNAAHERILARVKILANLKIDEHRMPQDGRFMGKFGEHGVDVRVSVLPLIFGEKIVMRLLLREVKTLTFEELGFEKDAVERITQHARKPYGMILVCGPTGVGKSTTLYALLQLLIADRGVSANINTIEDPVEYAIPRVNQVQAGFGTGLSFDAGLRGLLRQDVDAVMVGEIRDRETAEAAIEASLTGRLLLSSLHTRDAVGAIIRLLEIGIEPYLVSSAVTLVIAQRLVRTVCAACKESYQLDGGTFKQLAERYKLERVLSEIEKRSPHLAPIAMPPTLFRGRGCTECMQTGYRGRTAVSEVLQLTDTMRELIGRRATAQALQEQALGEGMITMFQNGFEKALSGKTTLEEVLKATLE